MSRARSAGDSYGHPPVTDKYGRVWVWWKGDLYRHCGMAWTAGMVAAGRFSLPIEPYPGMCDVCAGR